MKFKTPEGYRELNDGEIIRDGDILVNFRGETILVECSIGDQYYSDGPHFNGRFRKIKETTKEQTMKIVMIKTEKPESWARVVGAAIALGWRGYGRTLNGNRSNWSFRVYDHDLSKKHICSNSTLEYLNDSHSKNQVILDADNNFDLVLEFLRTSVVPEPKIKVGEWIVEFNKGNIKVGCTTIDNNTVREIAAKLKD